MTTMTKVTSTEWFTMRKNVKTFLDKNSRRWDPELTYEVAIPTNFTVISE